MARGMGILRSHLYVLGINRRDRRHEAALRDAFVTIEKNPFTSSAAGCARLPGWLSVVSFPRRFLEDSQGCS
jgi:hypothetical protein